MPPQIVDISSARIQQGVDRGEFHLLYQPRFCLYKRRIVSLEALLRWAPAIGGQIFPDIFIPAAEKNASISYLGQWAFLEACKQVARWKFAGLNIAVSINVSPLQCTDDFPEFVKITLERLNLRPDDIELEITENVLLSEQARTILETLKELGIPIAIDDFGTGQSALATLRNFKADTLKIDKQFFDDTPKNLDACLLARSIIRLGHSLGMNVVCEGIETVDQFEFCELSQADQIQGYYLSKPISAEKVEDLLIKERPRLPKAG